MREDDGLCWLQFTGSKKNGGGALCQSYSKQMPIRVFRSSELDNPYAPLREEEEGKVLFRYDGLYNVKAMWDEKGKETETSVQDNESRYTFFLTRLPKKILDSSENGGYYNSTGLHELWNEIQKKRGVRKTRVFKVPQPMMDLRPIGSKGSVRRRNQFIQPKVKKVVNRCRTPPHHGLMHSSSERDTEVGKRNSIRSRLTNGDSDMSNGRPRRASAAAARTLLQDVIQNRYGNIESDYMLRSSSEANETVSTRKRSMWYTDSNLSGEKKQEPKSSKPNGPSSPKRERRRNDLVYSSSDDDHNENSESDHDEDETDSMDKKSIDNIDTKETVELPPCEEKSSVEKEPISDQIRIDDSGDKTKERSVEQHSTIETSGTEVTNEKHEEPVIKRSQRKKKATRKKDESDESETRETKNYSNLDAKAEAKFDPVNIVVGTRIHVEYRDTLYKATVRRTRVKKGHYEFLIHYDGNKKSNVHWIQSSMIFDILPNDDDDDKPETVDKKRGRKTSSAKEAPGSKKAKKEPEVEVPMKFSIGSEVYVEYKEILYRATVRNSRVNKRRRVAEYLVHYDGFKKTADRWMAEKALKHINASTTRRFNRLRDEEGQRELKEFDGLESVEVGFSLNRKTRSKQSRDATEHVGSLDMGDISSGVSFLPGSCVFVVKDDALYLARMLKSRKRMKDSEYFVQYDGTSSESNSWVPVSNIYEIDPQTRKIYEKTAHKRRKEENEESSENEEEFKPLKKKTKRKIDLKREDTGNARTSRSKTNNKRESRRKASVQPVQDGGLNLEGIESGVAFLPGSTVFAVWKNALYPGKMLKKRGKGDDMEYLVHYDGFRKSHDEWIPLEMVYEINPQTKRAFRNQDK